MILRIFRGKCFGCGKKLGIFEGYSSDNKEFCKNCFPKRKDILKEAKLKENKRKEKEKKG